MALWTVFWNARALLATSRRAQGRKMADLTRILAGASVVSIVELHGSVERAPHDTQRILRDFVLLSSFFEDGGTGGVAILVRSVLRGVELRVRRLVVGRALQLEIRWESGVSLRATVVHNFEISGDGLVRIKCVDEDTARWYEGAPRERWALAGSDWNFLPHGQGYVSVAAPSAVARMPVGLRRGEHVLRWFGEVAVDLYPGGCTHFSSATSQLSRIDRVYWLGPSWACTQIGVEARVIGRPEGWHLRGISDHAPVQVDVRLPRVAARAPPRLVLAVVLRSDSCVV